MRRRIVKDYRKRKHIRVRKSVSGSTERPRLNVFRSSKHIRAQVVDDSINHTITSASSLTKEIRDAFKAGSDRKAAFAVGELIAKRAKEKGVESVVFDRGGYLFHGRVKELAAGARKGGLKF